jgi:hypothetical protein
MLLSAAACNETLRTKNCVVCGEGKIFLRLVVAVCATVHSVQYMYSVQYIVLYIVQIYCVYPRSERMFCTNTVITACATQLKIQNTKQCVQQYVVF